MMKSEIDATGEEFWLPSDFLTDDFFLDDGGGNKSPTETDSTENDDDESFMADLTKRMRAHSLQLHDQDTAHNHKPFSSASLKPSSVLGTSPQSTLCGIGSFSFSSNGSPDGPSQVSSPPSTPFPNPRDDALDLLCAAAGQVVRLGLNQGQQVQQARGGFLGQHRHPQLQNPNPNPNPQIQSRPKTYYQTHMGGLVPNHELIQQHQLQQARFYQLKRQQQILKQQFIAAAIARQQQNGEKTVRPLGLSSSAWPPLTKQKQTPALPTTQPQAVSGMTAVFLNGGTRRQSNGTGVFLPRRVGTPNEPKKKPGCSTVLLPARVVQALNLNLNLNGVDGSYTVENDGLMGRSVNGYPKRSVPALGTSHEVRLPQEWTY